MLPSNVDVSALPVKHLPLLRHLIDRLGITDVLEQLLPKDPLARVSDADCVVVMILNILQGRSALYRMKHWLAQTDLDVLLWADCPSDAFHDHRLGQTLDRLFDWGTEEVLSSVVSSYLHSQEAPRDFTIHSDATTLALFGAYDVVPDLGAPTPSHGHSKDHRPDLKQLVFGLALHGPTGMPLVATTMDGNATDQDVNQHHIAALASMVRPDDQVTFVGDCKLVDKNTLGRLADEGLHFVSLLSDSFALRKNLIDLVRTEGIELPELAREPGKTKASPPRMYRGVSFSRPMAVQDPRVAGKVGVRLEPMRLLVVQSPQLEHKFDTMLDKRLDKEEQRLRKAVRQCKPLSCEADAVRARQQILTGVRYNQAEIGIIAEEVKEKRGRRGRPRKGEEQPTTTVYKLQLHSVQRDDEAILVQRHRSSHFVLVTDHLDEGEWSDVRVLQVYRQQHMVEGTCGFRWLKGAAAVAPIFLETPRRIAALGLVFMLALMVRNYLQFELRRCLAEAGEVILYYDRRRKTAVPTAEVAMDLFEGAAVLHIRTDDRLTERRLDRLSDGARDVLRHLSVPVSVFTQPRQKIRPPEPATP